MQNLKMLIGYRLGSLRGMIGLILLLLSIIILIVGFAKFLWPETHVYHFYDACFIVKKDIAITFYWLNLQLKTEGPGLLAGEPISIYGVLHVKSDLYRNWKELFQQQGNTILIEHSESPEFYGKDISESISMDSTFPVQGYVTAFARDDQNLFILKGDVIFTSEGQIMFGSPLKEIILSYNTDMKPIDASIGPKYIKYQIDAGLRLELLSFIAVAFTCFGLFYANRQTDLKRKSAA